MDIPECAIEIEVVYALPDNQLMRRLSLPAGATARQAVALSGIISLCPEIDLSQNKLGVFGKLVKADAILRDRDRVEIYRPLAVDPREARRKRTEDFKAMKKNRMVGMDTSKSGRL
ncbi:RnfH family protein [Nitrosospira sp. NpAV]|uniref:RnfH family protein n=1 Tax=Nitrosospira sp. NpAV TaxID=58133 RepID=UPI0005A01FD8|nr:RnfH family protein [Nitrosospira sp. NpAV]KIO48868.1 RnfH [Nitrosospira sp. NpAV]